mmetsp:Transcript_3878/g.12981  ORF Transcript_3878/g.12981 Transcript_3878/m.12981 type:complete len:211 (+) Transcript_3878:463-1095(+)
MGDLGGWTPRRRDLWHPTPGLRSPGSVHTTQAASLRTTPTRLRCDSAGRGRAGALPARRSGPAGMAAGRPRMHAIHGSVCRMIATVNSNIAGRGPDRDIPASGPAPAGTLTQGLTQRGARTAPEELSGSVPSPKAAPLEGRAARARGILSMPVAHSEWPSGCFPERCRQLRLSVILESPRHLPQPCCFTPHPPCLASRSVTARWKDVGGR